MKVTITLRGTLRKYFGEDKERVYDVPEGCTCDEALKIAGLDYKIGLQGRIAGLVNIPIRLDVRKGWGLRT